MSANKIYKILWVDDEIDLLKPHILFLEEKGYEVKTALSGQDALDLVEKDSFDLVFLDEQMPGITGLEALQEIKQRHPYLPVIMVTKSEEEQLMHDALGAKIADYLIKPINPHQLLLALKKQFQQHTLINEAQTRGYRQDFSELSSMISGRTTHAEWVDIYKKLVYWELELEDGDRTMLELLEQQKSEAGRLFSKHIVEHYADWLKERYPERPLMSPDLLPKKVFPLLDQGEKVFFILIDNFRLDQWLSVRGMLQEWFTMEEEIYTTILPTATQYARNAIFSGLMPGDIAKRFPELWVGEDEEEGKNLNEAPLIQTMIERYRKRYTFSYNKVYETKYGERLLGALKDLKHYDLNVIVLNFVDMLSHARTESKMIRELASDEAAYRSLTKSWFRHGITYDLFKAIAEMGYRVVLTTDHGTIRVKNPVKIIGDRNTNTNLRYKVGKSLSYNRKEVFAIDQPLSVGLPTANLSDKYVFALGSDFFAYPNNYNYYVQYYRDTFQHGGVSMEEMLVPFITMKPK